MRNKLVVLGFIIFSTISFSQNLTSIQGEIYKDFEIEKYIDIKKIDFLILNTSFFMVELIKEDINNDFYIDTFDAMNPVSFELYNKYKKTINIFGSDYSPNDYEEFMKNKSLEINNTDTLEIKKQLTNIQYKYFLTLPKKHDGLIKKNLFLQGSGFLQGKSILFVFPVLNPHFRERYKYYATPCKYIILVSSEKKKKRKQLRKISKEFKIPKRKLKNGSSEIVLNDNISTLKIEFVDTD